MPLSRPLRPYPQRASPGWPAVYQRHTDHRRGQNFPHGDRYQKSQTGAHKVMPAYRARVSTPITFPSRRHRPEACQWTKSRPSHKGKCGCTGKISIQRHHYPVHDIFRLSYIQVQLKRRMTVVIACHEMQYYTCIT